MWSIGRAGSPYAVKDYYNVNPDLAVNPANRLAEFEALIARTHQHGLKVIIDIVPNHVARHYQSVSKPQGVRDFGEDDDTSLEYAKTTTSITSLITVWRERKDKRMPLRCQAYPQSLNRWAEKLTLSDGKLTNFPQSGLENGSRLAKPDANDWYETVKNQLRRTPWWHLMTSLACQPNSPLLLRRRIYAFWQQHLAEIPSSWIKFNQIAQYWLAKRSRWVSIRYGRNGASGVLSYPQQPDKNTLIPMPLSCRGL